MRRLIVYAQVLAGLLLCSFLVINMHYHAQSSLLDATTGILSHAIDPPLHSSPIYSPLTPSTPSIARVASISNNTHWMYRLASCGTMRCLQDLQLPLSKFDNDRASSTPQTAFNLRSPNDVHQVILNASPTCMIELDYSAETIQGERLTFSCFIHSALEYSTSLNLSLNHPLVGVVFETDLLMMKGDNIFSLNLDVWPHCPPANYNLSFQLNTPEITLSSEEIPLRITPVFTMLLVEFPNQVVQNQLFETTILVTNQGSQPRLILISAEADFRGNAQVIVQPNQTRLVPILVEYYPQNIMDTGVRLLLFALSFASHRLVSIGTSIFVGYSVVNMLITIAPFGFLVTLCVLGIRWLRIGKRSNKTPIKSKTDSLLLQHITESQLRSNDRTTTSENRCIQTPYLAKQMPPSLAQLYRQIGPLSNVDKQVTSNRVTLTWEENGAEVQIALPVENLLLINQVLNLIACKGKSLETEGEPNDQ